MSTRTHRQIIDELGGVTPLRRALLARGFDLPDATVRSWPLSHDGAGSIPPEYWPSLVGLELATLEELAAAAEARKFPDLAAERRSGQTEAAS